MENEYPTLQIDSRQHEGKHKAKHDHFRSLGIHLIRTKLYVGDYQFVGGTTSVDTKQSVMEVASNIDGQHERFRQELINAKEAGIQLVILVENTHGIRQLEQLATWKEPQSEFIKRKYARKRISGMRLAKAMKTMEKRYGVVFRFCSPDEAGQAVIDILKRGLNGKDNA